jgi:DNA primase
LVAKHGPDAVREAAAKARPLVEYMVRRTVSRHDLDSIEGQSAAVAAVLPMLERLSDPVRRTEYAHLVADLAGVDDASVRQSLDQRLGGRPQEVAKPARRTTARERVEREMLKLLARSEDIFDEFQERLSDDHLRGPSHRKLLAALRESGGDVARLAGGEGDLSAAAAALAVEPLEGEPTAEYAEGVWSRLQEFVLKGRSDELRLKLQRLNPTTDEAYDELFESLVAVDGELRRLRQRHEPAS